MKLNNRAARNLLISVLAVGLSGCITSRIEDTRQFETGLEAGEGVVVMAKSYHLGNETEEKYIRCIEKGLEKGSDGLRVIPHRQFVDSLFPWFEPRTAPADTKHLPRLMSNPGVSERISEQKIRYIVWLDGDTERVAGGGSLSCAAGPGGGGCFGFAWWQNDADYEAAIWDLTEQQSSGTITTDISGTSFMPALVIPIPLIARARAKACDALADQLREFITGGDSDDSA